MQKPHETFSYKVLHNENAVMTLQLQM